MKPVPMQHPIVEKAVRGDPHAIAFLQAMAQVMHTWDDLTDRDQPVTDAEVFTAFWLALVELPNNPFYAEHGDALRPIVVNAIVNWRIANKIERAEGCNESDLGIAFIIRSSYVDLLTMCATIIGGVEWAVHHGVEIRRWAHGEGFDGYLKNLAAEVAAREGANEP